MPMVFLWLEKYESSCVFDVKSSKVKLCLVHGEPCKWERFSWSANGFCTAEKSDAKC